MTRIHRTASRRVEDSHRASSAPALPFLVAGNAALARAILARSPELATDGGGNGFQAIYEQQLREGLAKLEGVNFGRAEGSVLGPDERDSYDEDYWVEVADTSLRQDGRKLVLKPGRKPSEAIDAMFANLAQWRLDCAQYVQIAELYALRHARGAEAFDAEHQGASFEFKPLDSTGLDTDKLFYRPGPDGPMHLYRGNGPPTASADEVVANAPVGSRVGFRNLAAPRSSAFYNENTIKLGPDEFAAHGLGEPSRFTRQEIVRKLAEITLERPVEPERDFDYIAENVFVVEVQYFKLP